MDFQNEASIVLSKNHYPTVKRSKRRLLYLRRALVLFVSASLISILLSWYSELSFLQSQVCYFSTFLLPFFTQFLGRKCMFLLCNGILVFLASKSGLCLTSGQQNEAEADEMSETTMNADSGIIMQTLAVVEPESEVESITHTGTVASMTTMFPQVMLTRDCETELIEARQEAQDDETVAVAAEYQAGVAERSDHEEDQAFDMDVQNEDYGLIVGGDTDTETEGTASNTEELNKKIEEFIRKMKEELRLEAQQQPVVTV